MITQTMVLRIPEQLGFKKTNNFNDDFFYLLALINKVPAHNHFLTGFAAAATPIIQAIQENSVMNPRFEFEDEMVLKIDVPEGHTLSLSEDDLPSSLAIVIADAFEFVELFDTLIFELLMNRDDLEDQFSPSSPLILLEEDLDMELAGGTIERTEEEYLFLLGLDEPESDGFPLLKRFIPVVRLSALRGIDNVYNKIGTRARKNGDSNILRILCAVLNKHYAREKTVCPAVSELTLSLKDTKYWVLLSQEVREAVLSKQ